MKINTSHIVMLIVLVLVLVWSGINPHDRFTWYLEVAPAVIGAAILAATYKKFKFTTLTYSFIFFFCLILIVGGKYTYAEVPIGHYIKDMFGLARNHYDRFGHFFQGVIPALIARELLIRVTKVPRGKMLFFLCVCVAMFVSSGYELIEWASAEMFAEGAADFLGLQGDIWDAQKDMLMALCGSITVQLLFNKEQNRQIKKLS
ncbi:putative membrane protein [Parelusimicrobium proximum]|uniref:DUF2238 domain-containing protein n=1 Tax=Parelusimicrobium proximum TaxID=3228953 RepID=UPI003D172821